MNEQKIELAVFDMAGTTVLDERVVEGAMEQVIAEMGLEVDSAWVTAVQGQSKIEVFRKLWIEKAGYRDDDLEERISTSYDRFREVLEERYMKDEILPTVGCLEMFEELRKKGVKIALNTGFYRKVTDIILDRLGWVKEGVVDATVSSDEVNAGRPHADMILEAMARVGVKNIDKVLCVGDTPSDIGAGRSAGCLSLVVTNGTHTREQLEAHKPDALLSTVKEVLNYV